MWYTHYVNIDRRTFLRKTVAAGLGAAFGTLFDEPKAEAKPQSGYDHQKFLEWNYGAERLLGEQRANATLAMLLGGADVTSFDYVGEVFKFSPRETDLTLLSDFLERSSKANIYIHRKTLFGKDTNLNELQLSLNIAAQERDYNSSLNSKIDFLNPLTADEIQLLSMFLVQFAGRHDTSTLQQKTLGSERIPVNTIKSEQEKSLDLAITFKEALKSGDVNVLKNLSADEEYIIRKAFFYGKMKESFLFIDKSDLNAVAKEQTKWAIAYYIDNKYFKKSVFIKLLVEDVFINLLTVSNKLSDLERKNLEEIIRVLDSGDRHDVKTFDATRRGSYLISALAEKYKWDESYATKLRQAIYLCYSYHNF